jgi:hypothetical protein
VSLLTSMFSRAWRARLAAIVVLSLAPGSERPENALGCLGSMSICSHMCSPQEQSAWSIGKQRCAPSSSSCLSRHGR